MSDIYPFKIDPTNLPYSSGAAGFEFTSNITPILDDNARLARWYTMRQFLLPDSILSEEEYYKCTAILSVPELRELDTQLTDMLRAETEAQIKLIGATGANTVNPQYHTWQFTPEDDKPGLLFSVDKLPKRMKAVSTDAPLEIITYVAESLADYAALAAADARETDQRTVLMLKDIFKLNNWSFDPKDRIEPTLHDTEPEVGDFDHDMDLFSGDSGLADEMGTILLADGYINLSEFAIIKGQYGG